MYDLKAENRTKRDYHLRVMTMQAATLAAATQTAAPWATLVYRYPILHEVAQQATARGYPDLRDDTLSLLDRYSREWLDFWSAVRPPSEVPA